MFLREIEILSMREKKKKHCFLAMFTEGEQSRKHCFLVMFPEGGQTRKHLFLDALGIILKKELNQTNCKIGTYLQNKRYKLSTKE